MKSATTATKAKRRHDESWTENHSHNRARRVHSTTTTVLLE